MRQIMHPTQHNMTDAGPGRGNGEHGGDYWLDIFGDVDFPTHRAALWKHAKGRKADALLLNRVKEMPERTYKNMEEFRKAFAGKIDNYGNVH